MNYKMKHTACLILFAAAASFSQLLNAQPNAYLLGVASMNQKAYSQAVQRFTDGLNLSDLKTFCYLNRGVAYYKMAKYDEAIKDFMEAEKAKPGIASFELSRCYARMGNIENTIYYLRNHLESPYKLPEAEIKTEEAFNGLDKYKDWKELWQTEWYNKAEKIAADANYLVNSGENVEAVDLVNNSLIKFPSSHALYVARARAFTALGNPRSALDDYSSALSLSKRNAEYFSERGNIYVELGKDRKAIDDYSKALKLKPELFDLYLKRAEALKRTEDYPKALQDIEIYLAFYPDNDEAAYEAGQIYYESDKYDQALAKLSPLIEKNPSKPEYYHMRGLTYFEIRNLDAAIHDFSQALDLNPKLAESWYNLGLAKYYKGDKEGACQDWKKASELGNQSASEYIGMYCQ